MRRTDFLVCPGRIRKSVLHAALVSYLLRVAIFPVSTWFILRATIPAPHVRMSESIDARLGNS